MKLIFTSVVFLLSIVLSMPVSAQSDGDYRTVASGNWSSSSIWERYDAMIIDWLPAGTAPTSADGVITIRTGDSLVLGTATTIDQVVIETGAVLNVYIPIGNPATTFTVANGAGDDITVNGKLYVSEISTTLSGAGSILINASGTFYLRGNSKLGASLTSNGHVEIGGLGTGGGYIIGTGITLTSNNTMEWKGGSNVNIALQDGGSLVNNGDFIVNQFIAGNINIYSLGSGTKQFVNTGIFTKNTTGTLTLGAGILNNSGTIKGSGIISMTGAVVNTGTIAPGLSPGTLTVSPLLFGANTSTVEIEVTGAGTVAGTDYDQLNTSGATDLTNTTLSMIDDNSTTPVGTVFTIMTSSGTFTGGPAFITANSSLGNFGNLTVNANTVTIEKLALLPVKWGNDFTPLAKNNKVELSWSTLQEVNNGYFVIEYSTDGSHFTGIGQLAGQGNSSLTSHYTFWHNTPNLNKTNFYRIKQVDMDGKATYSVTRSVQFTNGKVKQVTSYPNPVRTELILTVQEKNLLITLNNINGVEVRRWRLEPGTHPMNLQQLSSGMYQLNIYDSKHRKIDGQKIIKL